MPKAKPITIQLSIVEAQHVSAAISSSNKLHLEQVGRSNVSLDRAQKKLLAAMAEPAKTETETQDADAPADE